jgi:hypothetical protein
VIAGLLLLVGVIVGFSSVSAGSVSCGSAFSADSSAVKLADAQASIDQAITGVAVGESYAEQCSSSIGTRRAITWPLIGVGVLGLVFVGLTAAQQKPETASALVPALHPPAHDQPDE